MPCEFWFIGWVAARGRSFLANGLSGVALEQNKSAISRGRTSILDKLVEHPANVVMCNQHSSANTMLKDQQSFLFENDFCTFLYFSDFLIMVVVSPTSRHRVRGGTDAEASTSLRNQVGILDIG